MNDIIKIQEIGLDKLNNAEFVAFMTRFDELVSKAGTLEGEEEKSALGFAITELEAFDSDLNLIKDLVDQSRISDYTAQLQGIDKERDDGWSACLPRCVRERHRRLPAAAKPLFLCTISLNRTQVVIACPVCKKRVKSKVS